MNFTNISCVSFANILLTQYIIASMTDNDKMTANIGINVLLLLNITTKYLQHKNPQFPERGGLFHALFYTPSVSYPQIPAPSSA